jgi:hypothetical protein
MATPVIGLFGSNVGKGIKLKDPYRDRKPVGVMSLTDLQAPAVKAAPTIKASPIHPTQTQLNGGVSSSSSSSSSEIPTNLGPTSGGDSGNELGHLLGVAAGGLEGFIGHLGSDVIHTAMGLPVGVAYMMEHPIAGLEGAVKMTWADWSPLYHAGAALATGNFDSAWADTSLWANNFYEHPLAPLLDVAGLLTFGAGTAARGAAIAGKLGEAANAADSVALGAAAARETLAAGGVRQSLAYGGAVDRTAAQVGEVAGSYSAGLATNTWWMKAERFASPSAYAAKTYGKLADTLGWNVTPAMRQEFINGAMANDPLARRIFDSATDIPMYADRSSNPWTRWRQAAIEKHITEPLAQSKLGKVARADKVMGRDAHYRKLARQDAGVRRAAMRSVIPNEISALLGKLHDTGVAIRNIDPVTRLQHIVPGMRTGLVGQAHIVRPAGALGSAELDAQVAAMRQAGYQFVASDAHTAGRLAPAYAKVDKAGEPGFNEFLKKDWSAANTTNDPALALKDADGNFRVVSSPDKVAKEALFSHAVLKTLISQPTKVWKYLILGTSPRYFVNNFVGNTLMLAAATNPVAVVRGFNDYMRTVRHANADWAQQLSDLSAKGASAEDIALAKALHNLRGGGNWMNKWFAGEYGFGQMNMLHEDTKWVKNPLTGKDELVPRNASLLDKANSGRFTSLHHITNKYADMPQRYMSLIYSMKRMPEFQQAYAQLRAGGMRHFEAEQKAADMAAESPAVRQIVRSQVHHMLGQYHTFTHGERAVTAVVPFYAWDRAIALHMKELIVNQPYKVAMGAAIGTLGGVKSEEILGQVPDFMLAAIPAKIMSGPLGALMGKNGSRISVINAASLNPYGTIADITGMGLAAGGIGHFKTGDSLGASLNPVLQSAATQITGTNLQTGLPTKATPGGPLVGTYLGVFGNVPQLNLAKALVGMEGGSLTSAGKPTLYAHNIQNPLSSWLGLSIRQVDLGTAKSLYDKQEGIKHPRKKKSMFDVPGL